MSGLAAVVLTLWAGSLWTVCAIAAPVAFAVLDDRHAAGRVAATLFEIETWLGAVCALLLFATAFVGRAANDMARFGLLHGISAVLFVAAALGALVLVLRFNRPAG